MVIAVSIVLTLLFDIPLQEVKNVILEWSEGLSTTKTHEQFLKEEVERKIENFASIDEPRIKVKDMKSYDEDVEEVPLCWNWQKGTFRELTPHQVNENLEQNSLTHSRLKLQDARRQSFIRMDHIDRVGAPWDLLDGEEASRRGRSPYRTLMNESEANDVNLAQDIRSQTRNNISLNDDDDFISGIIRRERISHREGHPSWEMLGNKIIEDRKNSRSTRSLSRHAEARQFSSESEEDDFLGSRSKRRVKGSRISDDDDWELHILRRSYPEKSVFHNEGVMHDEERNFTNFTPLGSSQEHSDLEVDEQYLRSGKDDKSSFSETSSEKESHWGPSQRKFLTSGSQVTSVEDDESVTSYDFVLRKNSKRISMHDFSHFSQQEGEVESERNVVKSPDMEMAKNSSGLFKRQSIIKSQASEEDPEYLLPERPKLVQQEQEHPFKKAWQEQKSRSEEDSYVVKEIKENKENEEFKESEVTDTKETKQHSGDKRKADQAKDVDSLTYDDFTFTYQLGSGDSESSNSGIPAEEDKYD